MSQRDDRPSQDLYVDLIAELRVLQDAVAESRPSRFAIAKALDAMSAATRHLDAHRADLGLRPYGRCWDEPGRGQALVPPVEVTRTRRGEMRARLRLTGFHAGSGCAHGGVVPLVFDEVLGGLANANGVLARTATLQVQYRSPTPLDEDLELQAITVAEEGRKLTLDGTLRSRQGLHAEARALFVTATTDRRD